MIDTVIFDMDGVIVDSEPIHIRLERQMFNELGVEISVADHAKFVGRSAYDMWSTVVEEHNLKTSAGELVRMKNERFLSELKSNELPAVPYVSEAINALHTENYTLVLASSADINNIRIVLERLSLTGLFKSVVSGAALKQSKPHPEIFLKAADSVFTNPGNCVVIEDSANGVIAAKAAGMACIGFVNPNSGNQDLSRADIIVRSFEGILDEIKGIRG